MSSLRCSALGLNRPFPRAILHGTMLLGRIGIPTTKQKATKDHLNYFLYNIYLPSVISKKLDITNKIFTQLQIGTFHQFLSLPFQRYGHLSSQTMCVQIWKETSDFGVQLCPSQDLTSLNVRERSEEDSEGMS
jgi:hypothetical protein